MSYLTDGEKRILLSAIDREKRVCEQIDKEHPDAPAPLMPVIKSLERKFMYDRFEKDIETQAKTKLIEEAHWTLNKEIEQAEEYSIAGYDAMYKTEDEYKAYIDGLRFAVNLINGM